MRAHGTEGTVSFDGTSLFFTADDPRSDAGLPDNRWQTYFEVTGANGQKSLVEVEIHGQNDPITAVDDTLAIAEGQTSANLWDTLMANDQDLDYGFLSQKIVSVNSAASQGSVQFDAATKSLTYTAPGGLAEGETITDSFSYVVSDGYGSTDTATVTVTVTGTADGAAAVTMSAAQAPAPAGGSPFGAAPGLGAFIAEGGAGGADASLAAIPVVRPDMLFTQDLAIF